MMDFALSGYETVSFVGEVTRESPLQIKLLCFYMYLISSLSIEIQKQKLNPNALCLYVVGKKNVLFFLI